MERCTKCKRRFEDGEQRYKRCEDSDSEQYEVCESCYNKEVYGSETGDLEALSRSIAAMVREYSTKTGEVLLGLHVDFHSLCTESEPEFRWNVVKKDDDSNMMKMREVNL